MNFLSTNSTQSSSAVFNEEAFIRVYESSLLSWSHPPRHDDLIDYITNVSPLDSPFLSYAPTNICIESPGEWIIEPPTSRDAEPPSRDLVRDAGWCGYIDDEFTYFLHPPKAELFRQLPSGKYVSIPEVDNGD